MRAALDLIAREGTGGLYVRGRRALGRREVRLHPTGISATATNCCRTWRAAASTSSRRHWRARGMTVAPEPFAAFDRLGKAYLEFARTEPAYYSAMFEAGIPLDSNPDLRTAGEQAFAVFDPPRSSLSHACRPGSRPPALMMALHIWALSHGIASLFGRGDAAGARCRCRRRSCWKPASWSICADWASACRRTNALGLTSRL